MKMRNTYKLQITLMLSVGGLVIAPPLLAHLVEKQSETVTRGDKARFGEYLDYFNRNAENGRPLRLDISDPIAIVMQNIDLDTKKQIVAGINDLTDICPNLDYVVYENAYTPLNRISISISKELENRTLGVTHYNYSKQKAEIQYPISIELNEKYVDAYYDENDPKPIIKTVVKHELLHTLGLRDLYDENEVGKSIMYHVIDPNTLEFTARDKELIDYVYGDKTIATTYHPQTVVFYSNKFSLENETENLELEN